MNTNPDIVQFELYEVLGKSLGDDPRVLSLCAELVEKSKNPMTIRHALGAAHMIHEQFGAGPNVRLASIFRHGAERGDLAAQALAAEYLSALGGRYESEGYKLFAALLKKNPKAAKEIVERMIPSFGTTGEVLSFYEARLKKASTMPEAEDSLNGLRTVAATHAPKMGPKQRDRLAASFRLGIASKSPAIQLNSAFYLAELGNPYDVEARKFYEKRLRERFGSGPEAEAAKWASIRILRPMLQANKPDDFALLKDAAKSNDLLQYFESRFVSQDGSGNFNREMWARWKALIDR